MFVFLEMKEGIRGLNVSSAFLNQFAAGLILSFINAFLSYIVRSPEYYNIPKDQTATVVGDLGFYTELVIIPCHIILGGAMDIVGRRLPTVLGLLAAGISIILIPFGSSIYPTLCLLR